MPHCILVCDDEAHILHAVSFKLAASGYEVLQATNGREAIEVAAGRRPDLVITDLQMPEVDGLELCRFLRSRADTARVPVILLTARALELHEEQVRQQFGIGWVFMKPFSPRALVRTVEAALEGAKDQAAVAC